jgi:hypothetical protein
MARRTIQSLLLPGKRTRESSQRKCRKPHVKST